MTDADPNESDDSNPWLSRWMIGVGVVYLLFALNLTSFVVFPERVYQFAHTFDAPLDSIAFALTADLALLAGLVFGVIGAFLLWASRRPATYAVLVPLILALEFVAGILDDLYFIFFRDYTVDAIYYAFIALHLTVIVTGYLVYPRDD